MRNIEVAIALLFGYFIAWLTRHHGAKYVTNDNIDVSDSITFLWRQWFGIGFYSPALLRAHPPPPELMTSDTGEAPLKADPQLARTLRLCLK